MQARDIAAIDLAVGKEAGLLVVAIGYEEIRLVMGRVVEPWLRDQVCPRGLRHHR
jgi:hypothetical protein